MKLDKKQRIVKEGIKLFGDYGFKKVSVDMIVQKAKIAKGTFYLYFNSKEELYCYIFDLYKKLGHKFIKPLIDKIKDPKEKMYMHLVTILMFSTFNPILKNIILQNPDYYSEEINQEKLRCTRTKMTEKMFKQFDFNKYFGKDINLEFFEKIEWFYFYLQEIEFTFESKENFFDFAKNVAEILINGMSEKKLIITNTLSYNELKNISETINKDLITISKN